MDFMENYNCKRFREVESLHRVSVQASPLIMVLIRHARDGLDATCTTKEDGLVEDHFIIISEDCTHYVWAVKHGKGLVLRYLDEELKWCPKKIWYISDGAACQFKCATAFLHLSTHKQDHHDIEAEHIMF